MISGREVLKFKIDFLDLLNRSSPSRIVNVSSVAAMNGRLDVKDLNLNTSKIQIYSNSKLCNVLFTKELARRLSGSGVSVFSVHPGVIMTDIYNHMGAFALFFLNLGSKMFFKVNKPNYTAFRKIIHAKMYLCISDFRRRCTDSEFRGN